MTTGGTNPGTITSLIQRSRAGEPGASEQLWAQVHPEVRRIAQAKRNGLAIRSASLAGTELANEACLRLLGRESLAPEDRAHFFYLLGRAMRDAFADLARQATAKKRGGDRERQPLIDVPTGEECLQIDALELDDALEALRQEDEQSARILEHRVYSGRTLREISDLTGLSLHTVRRDLGYAIAWLREQTDR